MISPAHTDSFPVLQSPLAGVAAEAWSRFVRVLATAPTDAVSPANAIGAFELTPRRLADLGVLKGVDETKPARLKKARGSSGRMIWIGTFIDPRYGERLMRSLSLQYDVLCKSMHDYHSKIVLGEVQKPATLSLSGALAVLHRAGPQGLSGSIPSWAERTRELLSQTNGIF